jgi:uncharacterized protein (DUF433 family)
MKPSPTAHIFLDEQGRGWIDDTNVKVIEVVLNRFAQKLSPEEIHEGYPHLSMAQIHAALSYYYDHQAEYDTEIERQHKDFETLRTQSLNSPGRQKLRAMGLVP